MEVELVDGIQPMYFLCIFPTNYANVIPSGRRYP